MLDRSPSATGKTITKVGFLEIFSEITDIYPQNPTSYKTLQASSHSGFSVELT